MLNYHILNSLILFFITAVKADDTYPFETRNCPPRNSTTASKVITEIIFRGFTNKWPSLLQFVIKRKDSVSYIYFPFKDSLEKDNVHFTIVRNSNLNNFDIISQFNDDDSGADFIYGWKENFQSIFQPFCSILVNEDLTPIAILERHAPPELGYRDKKVYMEGEKIIVICTVQKLIKGNFTVNFPVGSNQILEESRPKSKEYSLFLTKKIKNKNISCTVPNGKSAWSTDYLKFIDKPVKEVEPDRTNLAISISVFCCLLLILMLIFGSYTLIIKQRKDNTKVMIEHHTETARVRRQSQIQQMTRMSMMAPEE